MKINSKEIAKTIIDFYEKNPTNCDFSLLWHNTYFTNYKYGPFLNVYKNIIEYIFENKIQCITPEELIKKNKSFMPTSSLENEQIDIFEV